MKFLDKISNGLLPIAEKLSKQRHLAAIRDSFIIAMPLIMAASFFILLNALIFGNQFIAQFVDLSKFTELGIIVNNGTLAILSILVAFSTGYGLANWYLNQNKGLDRSIVNGLHAGGLSVAVMFMMMPLTASITPIGAESAVQVAGVYLQSLTSASGLIYAMIASLISTELLIRFSKVKLFRITMPEGVPPAVTTTFNAMIPEILVVSIFAVFIFTVNTLTSSNIPEIVSFLIQKPLEGFVQNPFGMIIIQFFSDLMWSFGLHGSNILAPLTSPPLLAAIEQNMAAFSAGLPIPNIVTAPFLGIFGIMGGGGCVLALIIAIFIVSKRGDEKTIAKLGTFPSLFNISEPIMFGLPVVMNPIYMIPVVFVPTINLTIAYILTSMGLVGKTVAVIPWITPPVLSAWMATGGDIAAAVLAAALLLLDVLIYIPFVLTSNRIAKAESEVDAEMQ